MLRLKPRFILFPIIGFVIYSNSFGGGWHFDDVGLLGDPSVEEFGRALSYNFLRRLTYLSYAFSYHFWGYNAVAWHVFSWVTHVLTSMLVCLFVRMTCVSSSKVGFSLEKANRVGLFAGLLFLCHPVQTQAVNYLYQRTTLLAALFYVGTLTLYGWARVRPSVWRYGLVVCALILAFMTKPITVTLPIAILLYEIFFFLGG